MESQNKFTTEDMALIVAILSFVWSTIWSIIVYTLNRSYTNKTKATSYIDKELNRIEVKLDDFLDCEADLVQTVQQMNDQNKETNVKKVINDKVVPSFLRLESVLLKYLPHNETLNDNYDTLTSDISNKVTAMEQLPDRAAISQKFKNIKEIVEKNVKEIRHTKLKENS